MTPEEQIRRRLEEIEMEKAALLAMLARILAAKAKP